jgi:putative pyruvate formate lyase activating enzyme
MPGGASGTREITRFIADEISLQTYVNIMDQYHPCGGALNKRAIRRRITPEEFRDALDAAGEAGLMRLDDRHKHWLTIEF